jgi:hypothetical protein
MELLLCKQLPCRWSRFFIANSILDGRLIAVGRPLSERTYFVSQNNGSPYCDPCCIVSFHAIHQFRDRVHSDRFARKAILGTMKITLEKDENQTISRM